MPFDPVAADVPERRQRDAEAEGIVALSLGHEPLKTSAHLLVICLELLQQTPLVRPAEHSRGTLGHGEVVTGVTTTRDGKVAGRFQLRQRVLPDGLEH